MVPREGVAAGGEEPTVADLGPGEIWREGLRESAKAIESICQSSHLLQGNWFLDAGVGMGNNWKIVVLKFHGVSCQFYSNMVFCKTI